jgi:hypothetical protein
MVVHTYHPSYLEGINKRIKVQASTREVGVEG